jgi:hypothetical protein
MATPANLMLWTRGISMRQMEQLDLEKLLALSGFMLSVLFVFALTVS